MVEGAGVDDPEGAGGSGFEQPGDAVARTAAADLVLFGDDEVVGLVAGLCLLNRDAVK